MTLVGRRELDHPALGTPSNAGALHSSIETIYTTLSNDLASRYTVLTSVANNVTTTFKHNFGSDFNDLGFVIFTGTFPNITRVDNLRSSGWNIQPTSGNLKTHIDITTPSSGGPHTFVVIVYQLPEVSTKSESLSNAQPNYIPAFTGQQRVDSVYGRRWTATGRTASTDWKRELGASFDLVVNSNVGYGTHTTLALALAAAFDGARILVEDDQTLNSTLNITNKVHLVFRPGADIIKGSATTGISFNSGSSGSIIEHARFQGYSVSGDKPLNISTAVANVKVLYPVFATGSDSTVTDVDGNSIVIGQLDE